MIEINERLSIGDEEIELTASRSSGPGGQNVNKVSTRMTLRFRVGDSSLPDDVKEKIRLRLANRISGDDVLQISSSEHRSQHRNREEVIARFVDLVRSVLVEQRKRKPTRASRSQREQRLKEKKSRSAKKELRARVED
jgi:ribosome-associated protein